MPLYRDGAFVADDWHWVGEDEALAPVKAVVSKERFLKERPALLARNAPLGLALQAGEDFEGLEADLPRFELIALTLPKFTDGRAYSLAWLLRDRHGFAGEIRARGDILQDQLGFLRRTGFTAFDITHEPTINALRENRVGNVSIHYQPGLQARNETAPGGARPWLRLAPQD